MMKSREPMYIISSKLDKKLQGLFSRPIRVTYIGTNILYSTLYTQIILRFKRTLPLWNGTSSWAINLIKS